PTHRGPDALAAPRDTAARAALARHQGDLERALGGAGPAAARDGGGPAGGRSVRAAGRPTCPLGPRGPQRILRRGPTADGRRGARGRETAHPAALVAYRAAARAAPDAVLQRPRRRRGARSRLGSRSADGPRRLAARVAHAGAMHGSHGDGAICRGAAAGRRALMHELALYRPLLRHARPSWPHLAG